MHAGQLFASLAILQTFIAAVHLAWLPGLQADASLAGVPVPYRQFLLLATAGVGLLLAGMAALSLRFATGQRWRESAAPAFALIGAAVWLGRAALELLFPLQIPLFGRPHLSPLIFIDSLALVAFYLLAWLWSGDLAQSCDVPQSPLLDQHPMKVHYEDAFEIPVPPGTDLRTAIAAFATIPSWVAALYWIRDQILARPLRLPRILPELRRRSQAGELFPVIATAEHEQLMGAADKHLTFQVLARLDPAPSPRLVLHTRVHFTGFVGRLYFTPVGPVHQWLVPTLLGRTRRVLEATPATSTPIS
jgi:hypothetical protein